MGDVIGHRSPGTGSVAGGQRGLHELVFLDVQRQQFVDAAQRLGHVVFGKGAP